MRSLHTTSLSFFLSLGLVAPTANAGADILHTWTGPAGTDFGLAVAGVGDVDHDGYDDVAIGQPGGSQSSQTPGAVRVRSGKDGSVLLTFHGVSNGDRFGAAVAGAGDVDADGTDDVLVGAPQNPSVATGYARVYSGATGAILYTFSSPSVGDAFGAAVSGAGDVNGDGHADVAIGAPRLGAPIGPGFVRVLSGFDGSLLFAHAGIHAGDTFGLALSGGGDFTGDQIPDLLVGAPQLWTVGGGQVGGYARLISGATGLSVKLWSGQAAGDLFGAAVSLRADVDGDNRHEVIVGAPRERPGGVVDAGTVRLFAAGSGALVRTVAGAASGELLGFAVDAADVNDDGFDDVIVGAPGAGTANTGRVRVFSGRTGALLCERCGAAGSGYGTAVAGGGHVGAPKGSKNDVFEDVVVGAPGFAEFPPPGLVQVLSGRGLFLQLDPEIALAGQTLEIVLLEGEEADFNMLIVIAVNAQPTFVPLFGIGTFDKQTGARVIEVNIPNGVAGNTVTLQGFAQFKDVVDSAPATLKLP